MHIWRTHSRRLIIGVLVSIPLLAILFVTVQNWGVHRNVPHFPNTGFAGSDSLLTGLTDYWKMDETSGTRADSVGTNNLTSNNAVGFTAGRIGNAANFVKASNQSLAHASASSLLISPTTGVTFALWFKKSTASGADTLFSKAVDVDTNNEYALFTQGESGGEFALFFYVLGGTGDYNDLAQAGLTGIGRLTNGVWHFVVAWYDPADNKAHLEVDGVLQDAEFTTDSFPGPHNDVGAFSVGAWTGNTDSNLAGAVDEFGVWNRVLTPSERAELYNSGAGTTYVAATPTPPPAGGNTPTGQLSVNVVVVGGPLTSSYFTLFLDSTQMENRAMYTRSVGVHTISQNPATNYSTAFGGDCDSSGNLTVDAGTTKTCVVTNTYIGPSASPIPIVTPTPTPTPLPIVRPETYGLREGDVISAGSSDDPDIYIINEWGYKRLFLNPIIFRFYGHLGGFGNIPRTAPGVLHAFVTSGLFRNCETNDQKVYATEITGEDTGILHWVNISGDEAVSQDSDFFHRVFCINALELNWYSKGSDYTSVGQIMPYRR